MDAMGGTDVPFQGTYDGQEHKITNLIVNDGLFYSIGENGTVKNLTIENGKAERVKYTNTGIIATQNEGLVDNCKFVDCGIEINIGDNGETNESSPGIVCGDNKGTIQNCEFNYVSVKSYAPPKF